MIWNWSDRTAGSVSEDTVADDNVVGDNNVEVMEKNTWRPLETKPGRNSANCE
jgi:hypothetical protein